MIIKTFTDNGKVWGEFAPWDIGILVDLDLIFLESGQGSEGEYMPKNEAAEDFHPLSFLRGALYAASKCQSM